MISTYLNPMLFVRSRHTSRSTAGLALVVAAAHIARVSDSSYALRRSGSAVAMLNGAMSGERGIGADIDRWCGDCKTERYLLVGELVVEWERLLLERSRAKLRVASDGMFCWSINMMLSRRVWPRLLGRGGVEDLRAGDELSETRAGEGPTGFRFLLFPPAAPRFGERLALVADRKLELATLRKGVGRARKNRCDLGN